MNENNSRRVSILMSLINSAWAEIEAIRNNITDSNVTILKREIMNLLDGVGRGYVEGDYYAPSRYYSDIVGVKNIRIKSPDTLYNYYRVIIKTISPIGENLPSSITVRGIEYTVIIDRSTRYTVEVDY